jgi:hypothetical protein
VKCIKESGLGAFFSFAPEASGRVIGLAGKASKDGPCKQEIYQYLAKALLAGSFV